jgi:hypothetical protein
VLVTLLSRCCSCCCKLEKLLRLHKSVTDECVETGCRFGGAPMLEAAPSCDDWRLNGVGQLGLSVAAMINCILPPWIV